MKRTICVIYCLIFMFVFTSKCLAVDGESADEALEVVTAPSELPVQVLAKSAVLMGISTGEVLLEYNKDEKLFPASVTKIMTSLLVMEALDSGKITLADKVTCSANASSKGGSQIWLKEGEVMTVDELLKALFIGSANDAATLLGEYVAGDETAFVSQMNERAVQLGMKNTHFVNATGLDDGIDDHLSTAYDIALMTRELMKHKLVAEYSTVWMDTLRGGATELVNTNKLVRFYKGTTGLKTGTTTKAGCCVSATAERNGLHLAAVVLGSNNSNDRFETAKALLNWGFANFVSVTPEANAEDFVKIPVTSGNEDFVTPKIPEASTVLIKKGEEGNLKVTVSLCESLEAPVFENQTLGKMIVSLDDKVLSEYTVYPEKAISRLTFYETVRRVVTAITDFASAFTDSSAPPTAA